MTVGQLVDQAIAIAAAQGFEIRYDHLGGGGTGHCRAGARRWMVVDVAQAPDEQLDRLAEAIATAPLPTSVPVANELRQLVARFHASSSSAVLPSKAEPLR